MRKIQAACKATLVVCLTATAAIAGAQSGDTLKLSQIVERMQAAQKTEQNRPEYRVLREYRISGADASVPTSKILAEVDYVPPGSKQFAIRQAEGNERGEKIVRRVLEHEVRMTKDSSDSEFSPANYDFALLGQQSLNGKQCYVLRLVPKHETTELLKGKAWVDATSFLIVRAEGEPAKTPSWWIRDLHVAIDFGRADGIWLPLATRATAELRLVGTHVLTSRDVEVEAATQSAGLSRPTSANTGRKRSRNAAVDAGVWMSR
jgi:hypothetical protein